MEVTQLIPHVEALIFASDRALSTLELTDLINQAFGFMEDKIPMDQVEAAVEGIAEKYAAEFYPFEVRQSGGGWQFLTKKEYHKTIAQLNGDKFLKRLSVAALETLAIIAYRQPVTRSEMEAIRGVSVDSALTRLLELELVAVTGRADLPGRPLQYGTTDKFLDFTGLRSLGELPASDVLSPAQISEWITRATTPVEVGDAEVGLPLEDQSAAAVATEPPPAPETPGA